MNDSGGGVCERAGRRDSTVRRRVYSRLRHARHQVVLRTVTPHHTRGLHGNGEDWDPMGMGVISAMGWEWELSAWEWELRRGN